MKLTKTQLREIIREQIQQIRELSENLMGMTKHPVSTIGDVERYEYILTGKRGGGVTIDVQKSKKQGMPESNRISIDYRGESLVDTPKNFKKISELEAFIKKVHPTLVKIVNGKIKSNGVSFPD